MKIDLHCHSTASDGIRSPQELVNAAVINGLEVLSLTDHDSTENLDAVKQLCQESAIFFIPGIELSCEYNNESIHILGYFNNLDYQNPILSQRLLKFREHRDNRALEIAHRLKKYFDIDIDLTDLSRPEGSSLGRPHIAALIQNKYRLEIPEIFARYLGNHSKAYIPSSRIPIQSGISMLKEAGATVILAHPGNYKVSLTDLLQWDFDGVECYYATHTPEQTAHFKEICQSMGRLITCGSDDHGHPMDEKHGRLGETAFMMEDVMPFLSRFGFKPNETPSSNIQITK